MTRELLLLGLLRDLNRDGLLDMPDLFAGHFGIRRLDGGAAGLD